MSQPVSSRHRPAEIKATWKLARMIGFKRKSRPDNLATEAEQTFIMWYDPKSGCWQWLQFQWGIWKTKQADFTAVVYLKLCQSKIPKQSHTQILTLKKDVCILPTAILCGILGWSWSGGQVLICTASRIWVIILRSGLHWNKDECASINAHLLIVLWCTAAVRFKKSTPQICTISENDCWM